MAVHQASASAIVLDGYGIPGESMVTITVDDTTTIAQLATWADNYAGVVGDGNMTQGKVKEVQVRLIFASGEDTTTPVGDIEKTGVFNFTNATDSFLQGVIVPDLNPAVLNASGLIDLTNTTVTDYISFLTTVTTGITVVTKGLRALTGLADALISFRKHRKPLSRKTKEQG